MTSAPKTSISHSQFGLTAGAIPVRDVRKRRSPIAWSGMFASQKAFGPTPFESLLERDFQTLLSADPRIVGYAAQPHHLEYWTPDDTGRQIKRRYTPDYAARDRDGNVLIFEVKAKRFAEAAKWRGVEPYVAAAYEDDHGVRFLIFTEDEIRQQPRLSNCQMLVSHRADVEDVEADLVVSDILMVTAMPRLIGEVQFEAKSHGIDSRRAFAAIMRAVLAGQVQIDLSQPIGPQSILTPEGV